MITIKYAKTFPANMISHIDTLRIMQRIVRRMGATLRYSQGFNPHILMYFSPPLSLGLISTAEYVTIETEDNINISAINRILPQGFNAIKVWYKDKNPNLAGIVNRARYSVTCRGIGSCINDIMDKNEYIIEYMEKGHTTTKDVRSMIYEVTKVNDDNIELVLACGNTNLKADRLIRFISTQHNLDYNNAVITKTNMYINDVDVDQYLTQKDA